MHYLGFLVGLDLLFIGPKIIGWNVDRATICACRDIQVVDITTATTLAEDLSTALLKVDVDVEVPAGQEDTVQCVLSLLDSLGTATIAESFSCNGQLEVSQPQLWWPYLMSETPGKGGGRGGRGANVELLGGRLLSTKAFDWSIVDYHSFWLVECTVGHKCIWLVSFKLPKLLVGRS